MPAPTQPVNQPSGGDSAVPAASKASSIAEAAIAGAGNYRWVICALLFFATTINYIDRQILALIKEILDKDIGWTNEDFGNVNAAFQLAYGFGLLGFGWFVDRFGTKIGYAVSIAAWSVAAAGHALVGSVSGFITARVCLGLGESGNFPSAIKAVALWFPKRERAFATSIFNAGTNAGALVAPAIVPWLAFKFGWQSAFIAAGIAGGLWLFLWLPLYNTPARSRHVRPEEMTLIQSDREDDAPQDKMSWGELLKYRQTWSFVVAKFLTDPVWWFFLIWLPDFFKVTYHLDIKKSWPHIVTIYAIVTVLSIFGGWVTGYLTKHGWSVTRARKTGMFLFACCALPVFFTTQFGVWPAVLLIALAGSAHQAWSANLFTTVSDMFPRKAIGSIVGLGGMAGAAGGFFFPKYCGHVLDKFKLAGNPTGAYPHLLHILAFAYVLAFALNHLLAPRFEPIQTSQARG
jgi:ACS family hexuronate transporter-like MFS transporter